MNSPNDLIILQALKDEIDLLNEEKDEEQKSRVEDLKSDQ